jgi:crossover junction endodeoxyribonuclease RuvC
MIILGVDPGTATMGYGVLEKTGNRYRALAYGVLETPKTVPAHERLRALYHGLRALCETYQPDALATEQLLFQTNRRTAIAVARAAGIAMLVAAEQGIEWREYTPLQVKQAVTGYGGADKKQVQTMVQRLLGLEGVPKPDDAADALAVAICHAHHAAMNQLIATKP